MDGKFWGGGGISFAKNPSKLKKFFVDTLAPYSLPSFEYPLNKSTFEPTIKYVDRCHFSIHSLKILQFNAIIRDQVFIILSLFKTIPLLCSGIKLFIFIFHSKKTFFPFLIFIFSVMHFFIARHCSCSSFFFACT